MISLIGHLNRTRRDRILTWSPQNITEEPGSHFVMYDQDKVYQDSFAQIPGELNHPIALVKDISGTHKISTQVVERLLSE